MKDIYLHYDTHCNLSLSPHKNT